MSVARPFTARERDWLVACLVALGRRTPPPAPPLDLDWAGVLEAADAEGLVPALARALEAGTWPDVPDDTRRRLRAGFTVSAGRHLLLTRELGMVLRHCTAAGIDLLVLGGPVLADTVYPHPALRPFRDLDLLVRPADRLRMDHALRALGHRRVADARSLAVDVGFDGATIYETPAGVRVDLHCALLTQQGYVWSGPDADLWERAVPIVAGGETARGLGREDLVLYLTAHLAVHHALVGLRHAWDIALLLERDLHALDWEALVTRAACWRIRHALYFVLLGARRVFRAPVPASALAALKPSGPRAALLATLIARGRAERLVRLERLLALLLVDRGRDVYGPLRHALWPPASLMRARYGLDSASRRALYGTHLRRLGTAVGHALLALVGSGSEAP